MSLDKFNAHDLIRIFTDSLSSLQAILHRYINPGAHGPQHYHHHMLLLSGITDLLEERRRQGFRTTLHKIRAHTNIRGNDLADVAGKLAVTQHESLPESQKIKQMSGRFRRAPLIGACTPQPPHPRQSWGQIHGRLRCANRGGRFQRGSVCRRTLSRVPLNESDIKSNTRSYAASIISL